MTDAYDYSNIDRLLLKGIENGIRKYHTLVLYVGRFLSDEEVQGLNAVSTHGLDRAVDRRLQALRKQEKLVYTGRVSGWILGPACVRLEEA